jgi:hypothetical protein
LVLVAGVTTSLNVRYTQQFPQWSAENKKSILLEKGFGAPALGHAGSNATMVLTWTGTDAHHHLNAVAVPVELPAACIVAQGAIILMHPAGSCTLKRPRGSRYVCQFAGTPGLPPNGPPLGRSSSTAKSATTRHTAAIAPNALSCARHFARGTCLFCDASTFGVGSISEGCIVASSD